MPGCQTREENAADAARDAEDLDLTPDELDDKYNQDGDGEHYRFTRADWRDAVANEDTVVGYWTWVAYSLRERS